MHLLARANTLRRLTWLVIGALSWAALIFTRLFQLQIVEHGEYRRIADQQQEKLIEIPAPRGTIFDRTGQPLAMSVPMSSVFVNPLRIRDLGVAAELLAPVLDLNPVDLYGRLRWAQENRRGFLWIKRKIPLEQYERLKQMQADLDWIEFETESQRHYPKGAIASHILGSVDHEERGNAGLELGLDDILCGHAGSARLLTDVKNRGIDSQLSAEAVAGTNLTLTLDERIQFTAERELKNAVLTAGARTGSVVVMDPHTGDVLAMASYPSYNPNKRPAPGESLSSRLNLAISAPFEPGSVFKVITLSAALETTSLRPDTPINCGNGTLVLFGRAIHEAKHGYGTLAMADVLAKSSNIGAIQVGLRVGPQNLYEYVRRFGFGSPTGIPLPAENGGTVRRLKNWGKTSIASVSMGHEISVSTLQLARACSVIANGGLLVKPRLILLRQRPGGPVEHDLPEPPRRILKPETAFTMRLMMEGVVRLPYGTGKRARLEGYSSAGKTGSAQIYDFAARHYTHAYNASFMGFAPVTNPAIVVVVTLNGTHGSSGFGGAVAAPVFRAVAEETLRILEVPKDLSEPVPDQENQVVDEDDVSIADLAEPDESEAPNAASMVPASAPIPLAPGPRVPDFTGLTARQVAERAAALGIAIRLDGSGVARQQEPTPGNPLIGGEVIRVRFSR